MSMAPVPKPAHVPLENVVDVNIYSLPGSESDFHAAWKALQTDTGPEMLWTPQNGGHWIATRGENIKDILKDHIRFSSAAIFIPKADSQHYNILPLQADQPEHTEYRRAVNRAVSSKYILAMQQPAKELAAELAQEVLPRGRCEFISEIAETLPIKLFLAFAGLPLDDFEMLKPLGSYLVRKDQDISEESFMALVDDYLAPIVRMRMNAPEDDALSRVFAEKVFDAPITFDIAMGIARDVLLAGLDTVSSHIGFIGYHLARNPHHRKLLVENPKLLPLAVDDLMRRYNAVAIGREAVEDVSIAGVEVKQGDVICLPLPLYNLDDRLFENPMEAVLDRRGGEHLAFGAGIHRCPGNSLARIELMMFIQEWLAVIPEFSLDTRYPIRMKAGVVGAFQDLHLVWPTSK